MSMHIVKAGREKRTCCVKPELGSDAVELLVQANNSPAQHPDPIRSWATGVAGPNSCPFDNQIDSHAAPLVLLFIQALFRPHRNFKLASLHHLVLCICPFSEK